jgi:hypothetical protein
LLHKGGGTTIPPSDWLPVVLMDDMNQLLGYIVLERLTRLVEGSNVLDTLEPSTNLVNNPSMDLGENV